MADKKKAYIKPELKSNRVDLGVYGEYNDAGRPNPAPIDRRGINDKNLNID